MRRPPSLLGPNGAAPAWLLGAGLAIGALVAALVLALGAGLRLAPILAERLSGSATVAVSGRMDSGALESSDAAAARAREILAAAPGVIAARVLEPSPIDPHIAGALGAPRMSGDAGPPRLLAITLRPGVRGAGAALSSALRREGLAVGVDDHGMWSGPCERAALLGASAIGLALVAVVLSCALLGAVAARRRAEGAWDRLGLLARLGAESAPLVRAIAAPTALWLAAALVAGVAALLVAAFVLRPTLGAVAAGVRAEPTTSVLIAAAVVVCLSAAAAASAASRTASRGLRAILE